MAIDLSTVGVMIGAMLLAGAVVGTMAGLLGIGGGFIIVPALLTLFAVFGVDEAVRMQLAVGTSLSTIIATSLSAVRSHHKRGAVDWRLLTVWGPAIATGVVIGAWIAGVTHGQVLKAVFAMVALAGAVNMTVMPETVRPAERPPGPLVLAPIGVVIGLISSLAGIGGALIAVPIMARCGYPMPRAVGTAAAMGFIIAVFGTAGFIVSGWGAPGLPPFSLGFVSVIGFLVLVPTTVLFAPLGVRLAHAIRPVWLKRGFALFLAVTSFRMFWGLLA